MIVKQLTDGLASHSHTVHLFCAEGSETDGIEHSFGIQATASQEHTMKAEAYKAYVREKEHELCIHMMKTVSEKKIDIVHIHQPIESLSNDLVSHTTTTPFIFTFHDPITSDRWKALTFIQERTNGYFVSISDAQRRNVPLSFIGTVHHGTVATDSMFKETVSESSRFLVVGRIVPKKGVIDAMVAVKRINETLMIVGQVYRHKAELAFYFDNSIKPHIDNVHIFMEEKVVGPEQMTGQYQRAKALLFPIQWEEPFGLVMIEAMACGTPVIAYNRGSVPEVVKDGITGFIIDPDPPAGGEKRPGKGTWIIKKQGIEGLGEAIRRIGEIDRRACRKHVEDHFTVGHMVDTYETIYREVIALHGRH
jgi:glycosyltransferase involved in cell wall biosynthesis